MWNRCADVTPPKNEPVLCMGARGGYFIGRHLCGELFITQGSSAPARSAVYWMEIPPAPWEMTRSGGEE